MLKPLKMPQIALGAEEVIARDWLLEPGAEFTAGQAILEIETDKATTEVEAPFDGMLVAALCGDGEAVAIGEVIGYAAEVGASLEKELAALAELSQGPTSEAPAPSDDAEAPPASAPAVADGDRGGDGELVRFVLVPHGELAGLPAERLAAPVARSTEAVVATPELATSGERAAAGPSSERRLSRRRLAIARRMAAATAIPCFVVTREIATEPAKRAVAAARGDGLRATFTDLLLRACVDAAATHPTANAWLLGETLVEFEHVNVSLAVDSPDGVVAPVLKALDTLDFAALVEARSGLVRRAREGRLVESELLGATLTLSNVAGLGAHGILPVLTAPQVAAVGVGMARAGGPQETIAVSLVADHRVLDGADGARFLTTFAEALESASTAEN